MECRDHRVRQDHQANNTRRKRRIEPPLLFLPPINTIAGTTISTVTGVRRGEHNAGVGPAKGGEKWTDIAMSWGAQGKPTNPTRQRFWI